MSIFDTGQSMLVECWTDYAEISIANYNYIDFILCAGYTGQLNKIRLQNNSSSGGGNYPTVSVYTVNASMGPGTLLAQQTYLGNFPAYNWCDITFSSPTNITLGDYYYVRLDTSSATGSVAGNLVLQSNGVYSPGMWGMAEHKTNMKSNESWKMSRGAFTYGTTASSYGYMGKGGWSAAADTFYNDSVRRWFGNKITTKRDCYVTQFDYNISAVGTPTSSLVILDVFKDSDYTPLVSARSVVGKSNTPTSFMFYPALQLSKTSIYRFMIRGDSDVGVTWNSATNGFQWPGIANIDRTDIAVNLSNFGISKSTATSLTAVPTGFTDSTTQAYPMRLYGYYPDGNSTVSTVNSSFNLFQSVVT